MDSYSVLGLKKGANLVQVKASFRRLSKELHPDVNGGSKDKSDRFLAVLAAYQEIVEGRYVEKKQYYSKPEKKQEDIVCSYNFKGVKTEKSRYIFSMFLHNVEKVVLSTNNGRVIGEYNTKGVSWDVNLRLEKSELKGTDYLVKLKLVGKNGGHIVKGYKFKKPSLWKRFFSNLF